MTTQLKINRKQPVEIRWEDLPVGFRLDDEPVENTGQPLKRINESKKCFELKLISHIEFDNKLLE
jgi:hypothetical protein